MTEYFGEHMLGAGWVAACAIDIPGTYVLARMIFGRHPAVPFLLLLAISADAIGLAAVALVHPVGDAHPVIGLVLMAAAVSGAAVLRRRRRQELLAVPARSRRRCPGGHCSSAACTPRWRWCPSSRSFRTAGAIEA